MAWTKIFKSHHSAYLEQLVDDLQIRHHHEIHSQRTELKAELSYQVLHGARLLGDSELRYEKEISRLESLHLDAEVQAMTTLAAVNKAHAAELSRVIEENARLRDDLERVRLYLTPALQSVSLPKEERDATPPTPSGYAGTPWQRIIQREMESWNTRAKAADAPGTSPEKPAEAAHGNAGERRNDASQRNTRADA